MESISASIISGLKDMRILSTKLLDAQITLEDHMLAAFKAPYAAESPYNDLKVHLLYKEIGDCLLKIAIVTQLMKGIMPSGITHGHQAIWKSITFKDARQCNNGKKMIDIEANYLFKKDAHDVESAHLWTNNQTLKQFREATKAETQKLLQRHETWKAKDIYEVPASEEEKSHRTLLPKSSAKHIMLQRRDSKRVSSESVSAANIEPQKSKRPKATNIDGIPRDRPVAIDVSSITSTGKNVKKATDKALVFCNTIDDLETGRTDRGVTTETKRMALVGKFQDTNLLSSQKDLTTTQTPRPVHPRSARNTATQAKTNGSSHTEPSQSHQDESLQIPHSPKEQRTILKSESNCREEQGIEGRSVDRKPTKYQPLSRSGNLAAHHLPPRPMNGANIRSTPGKVLQRDVNRTDWRRE